METTKYLQTTTDRRIHLFFLPFAGGSSYSYRGFEQYCNGFIKMMPVELPGHGKKLGQPLLTNIHEIADYVFHQIKERLYEPYAIYGHSMGALIGYLLSKKVAQPQMLSPLHLFLSGHQGPPITGKEKDIHLLPKKEFIRRVLEYGGIPREIAGEEELMNLFAPILRADFQAVAEYQYEEADRLDIPITVMLGEHESFTYEEALTWQEVTRRQIRIKQFPGNHFFIFEHIPVISDMISRTLAQLVYNGVEAV